jgi:hypothetical protein
MVAAAERNRELIADLAAERSALRETKVVGVSSPPAANQAGLLSYKSNVVPVTQPARSWHRQYALIN